MMTLQKRVQPWAHTVAAAFARSILIAVLLLVCFGRAGAATINALDCSLTSVQTACAAASPGDTVVVPAGSAVWTGTLNIYQDIQLIGAGIGQTIITNDVVGSLINWQTTSNGTCRLAGFDFEPGPPDAVQNSSTKAVCIFGNCHAFRLDDCLFDRLNEYNLWFAGWVYGVVDHCTFNAVCSLMEIQMNNYGGQSYGDGSWADADYWGTTNALYIESCTFNGPAGYHLGMLDGVGGQRVVVRYCNSTNCPIGSHGTDSTTRTRSVRSYEVYNNNFIYQTNGWPAWGQVVYMRGGTALIFSNTIWGGYQAVTCLADYRYIPVQWPPFGQVTGNNPWDDNNPTMLDSGTASGANGSSVLVDGSKNWAPNCWVSSTQPFILYDVTQGYGAIISGNTGNTISFSGSFGEYQGNNSSGALLINSGDTYQIRQVYATLDQPGCGQGDLLTGATPVDTVSGTANWPNEVSDPVYIWANNFTFALPPGSYPSETVSGNPADYVTGAKPGYQPLSFPHPLVAAEGVLSGGSSGGSGGSGGSGNGSVAPPTDLQAHTPGT